MPESTVLPPPLSSHDIKQSSKLLHAASQDPRQPLNTDSELIDCLYYPLRQVPLPSFQYEMLIWENDKQNVFNGAEINFTNVVESNLADPLIKYKRVDPYTVLAVVVSGNAGAVFTNEMSQTSWELIGAFNAEDLVKHIKDNKILVDHEFIESSYNNSDGVDENKDSDDDYWNKYDEEPSEETRTESQHGESEEAYWNRHTEESEQIDSGTTREFAVQAIADLFDLYRDCGKYDTSIIAADIKSIAFGTEPLIQEISPIAHKHAKRTLDWISTSSPSTFSDEVLLALQLIV